MRGSVLAPSTQPGPRRGAGGKRVHRKLVVVGKLLGLAVVIVVTLASFSYARALTAPGYATWNDRTSSWVRSHGGASLLDAYENWRYASPPPNTQPDLSPFVVPSAIPGGTVTTLGTLPVLPIVAGQQPPTWIPGRTGPDGTPVAYSAVYQPDPAHRSAIAAVAVISRNATTAHLVAGTSEPDTNSSNVASVPSAEVPSLVAAFNSGFKMKDIAGGFYQNGKMVRALHDGQASAVIDKAGHLRIVEWSSGSTVNSDTIAVRQNLALLVVHGSAAPGLHSNSDLRWGSAKNQLQYTERSALGVDANGNLLYVAASKVDLATLAAALIDAGAVTGMELDIHTGMTTFNSWVPGSTGSLTPTPLLPGIQHSPNRYLNADQRDFFYFTLASPTPNQHWNRS
ncbi:phosphodiester glycosidase family protein [Rhodococcus qingshengii]|uniref:phosphodiester glycosidase family protein n=1 Tax=Rhodococcus qingshengii TaxID=334542 RepID=UPI0024B8E202|nr:phosphodiester glycosidase family protein [Rhodococcus qingshengii]MDJ0441413.1 phosphodiester glycosidase family protein [Rhodococcus qingshengii]